MSTADYEALTVEQVDAWMAFMRASQGQDEGPEG